MKVKKYYWLKLKYDFFKRHDVRIVENMQNGKDYVIFYLKLLVESLKYSGRLRFSETIPYNDDMLATITNTNIDIVRQAIKIFCQLELMEIQDDGTIYLKEVENMTGSETEFAEKKRQYRLENKTPESPQIEAPKPEQVEEKAEQKGDKTKTMSRQKKTMSDKSKEYRVKSIDNRYIYIVNFLNEKAGTGYKPTGRKTQDLINAIFNEGFNEKDFEQVIEKKVREWKGTEMEKYLTPETLFGTKFEKYLNQRIVKANKQTQEGGKFSAGQTQTSNKYESIYKN